MACGKALQSLEEFYMLKLCSFCSCCNILNRYKLFGTTADWQTSKGKQLLSLLLHIRMYIFVPTINYKNSCCLPFLTHRPCRGCYKMGLHGHPRYGLYTRQASSTVRVGQLSGHADRAVLWAERRYGIAVLLRTVCL